MPNYYVDINQDLADKLDPVPSADIVEALEEAAASYQNQQDGDELAKYDTLAELKEDDSLSAAERKRRELRWQRVVSTRNRH